MVWQYLSRLHTVQVIKNPAYGLLNKDGVNRPVTDSKDYLNRYYILFTIFILVELFNALFFQYLRTLKQ